MWNAWSHWLSALLKRTKSPEGLEQFANCQLFDFLAGIWFQICANTTDSWFKSNFLSRWWQLDFGIMISGNTAFLGKMRFLCSKNDDLTWFVMIFVTVYPLTISLPGGCSKNGYVVFRPTNNEILIFRAWPKNTYMWRDVMMARRDDGEADGTMMSEIARW